MPRFEDHFSAHAREYALHRPGYPSGLFEHLAALVPKHELAWDCGTGNGQAALELARVFARVVATDASADQIANAFLHPSVQYRVEPAEQVSIEDRSVDLAVVAQAVHWFDLERFYAEVRRVVRPGGMLVVWTYHLAEISPAVDAVLSRFYFDTLAGYWPERIHYLEEGYATLPFPFPHVPIPAYAMQADWDLTALLGFLDSWSAVHRYRARHGRDPIDEVREDLAAAWGKETRRMRILWPLSFRAGRIG
ncbi:MAG: class I SAM-dependent methyltransferase [Candidatus Eisenbacteria bacterium]